MNEKIPEFLKEMLLNQYGEEILNQIINGYVNRSVTLRINTIKTNKDYVKNKLIELGINFKEVIWNEDALIIENANEVDLKKLDMYKNGEIYLQSLSSMLPVIVLNPKKDENILDMAAAPGGKTTQIAALCDNNAMITACEKNKIRSERLKYNLKRQGVGCVNVLVEDARKLSEYFSFDKILLDAPCSGSGTENINEKQFTKELIERSQKTQIELLKKAIQILKPGKEMVYSTCSILGEENEEVIKKFLNEVEVVPIDKNIFENISLLPTKIEGTICIAPSDLYEGFFVAKLKKK